MVYKVIGLMSGSSLDGLDIAYTHLHENAGKWEYQIVHAVTYPYPSGLADSLATAGRLPALDYQLLHTGYGHWLGEQVLRFIENHDLAYQVQLIASHGHTVFHLPAQKMTAQLGDGAAIAATTGINVVSDLRAMDLALGGQGAPIVPVGEKLLMPGYEFFLNLGGIANLSAHRDGGLSFAAFDICPANRVLNMLAAKAGMSYDDQGSLAESGKVDKDLLQRLNELSYYGQGYPKSLANDFGTDTIYPLLSKRIDVEGTGNNGSVADALRTYTEHIAVQTGRAIVLFDQARSASDPAGEPASGSPLRRKVLVTGGGAHNRFLIGRIRRSLEKAGAEPELPNLHLIDFKEALIMALLGVLRWREENNVLASVTGARRDSIGGAVWMGQDI
jgi:anhydro-N-acetylmuramic acid kinase